MNTVYFISDNHLGDGINEKLKKDKFISFLEHIKEEESSLFIVGDFFDFYFEYRKYIPQKYQEILLRLKELKEVHYFAGNHDFWIGHSLEERGIKIYKKPESFTIQGKRIFISHGDEATNSFLLRFILKNRVSIFLFSLIPPFLGYKIGELASRLSRKNSEKKNIRWKRLLKLARDKFKQGFDITIFGHIHLPKYIKMPESEEKIFLLLGDWSKHFSYGKLENGKLTFHYWSIHPEIFGTVK